MKFTSIAFAALVAATQFSSTFALQSNKPKGSTETTAFEKKVLIDVSDNDEVEDGGNKVLSIEDALTRYKISTYKLDITQQGSEGTAKVITGDTVGTSSTAGTPDQIEYTPNDGASGSDTFKYTFKVTHDPSASAGATPLYGTTAASAPATTVTVTIAAAVPASIAADDSSITTYADTAVTIDVSGTDTVTNGGSSTKSIEAALKDGDMTDYKIDSSSSGLTQPSDGTVVVDLGDTDTPDKLTYTPDSGFTGADTFTYAFTVGAADSSVSSATQHGDTAAPSGFATVTVTVSPAVVSTPVVKQTVEIPGLVSSGNVVKSTQVGLSNIAAFTPSAPDADVFNAIVGPVVGDSDNFAANTSTEAVQQNLSTIFNSFYNFFRGGN
jgi:hypothetical protein